MSLQNPTPKIRSVSPIVADLRSRRLALGLTQVEIAWRMKRAPQCLCDWENGKQDPHLRNLESWCAAIGVQLKAVE